MPDNAQIDFSDHLRKYGNVDLDGEFELTPQEKALLREIKEDGNQAKQEKIKINLDNPIFEQAKKAKLQQESEEEGEDDDLEEDFEREKRRKERMKKATSRITTVEKIDLGIFTPQVEDKLKKMVEKDVVPVSLDRSDEDDEIAKQKKVAEKARKARLELLEQE